MTAVVSTAGATEITHDGTTHVADENGVFDLPESLVASHGTLLNLVDAGEHAVKQELERLAEASKPESLHARLTAVEDVLAGVEAHIASKVEEAITKIEDAAKAAVAKAKPLNAVKAAETKPAEAPPAG